MDRYGGRRKRGPEPLKDADEQGREIDEEGSDLEEGLEYWEGEEDAGEDEEEEWGQGGTREEREGEERGRKVVRWGVASAKGLANGASSQQRPHHLQRKQQHRGSHPQGHRGLQSETKGRKDSLTDPCTDPRKSSSSLSASGSSRKDSYSSIPEKPEVDAQTILMRARASLRRVPNAPARRQPTVTVPKATVPNSRVTAPTPTGSGAVLGAPLYVSASASGNKRQREGEDEGEESVGSTVGALHIKGRGGDTASDSTSSNSAVSAVSSSTVHSARIAQGRRQGKGVGLAPLGNMPREGEGAGEHTGGEVRGMPNGVASGEASQRDAARVSEGEDKSEGNRAAQAVGVPGSSASAGVRGGTVNGKPTNGEPVNDPSLDAHQDLVAVQDTQDQQKSLAGVQEPGAEQMEPQPSGDANHRDPKGSVDNRESGHFPSTAGGGVGTGLGGGKEGGVGQGEEGSTDDAMQDEIPDDAIEMLRLQLDAELMRQHQEAMLAELEVRGLLPSWFPVSDHFSCAWFLLLCLAPSPVSCCVPSVLAGCLRTDSLGACFLARCVVPGWVHGFWLNAWLSSSASPPLSASASQAWAFGFLGELI